MWLSRLKIGVLCSFIWFIVPMYGYSAEENTLVNSRRLYMWQIDPEFKGYNKIGDGYRLKLEEKLKEYSLSQDTAKRIVATLELADLDRWKGDYVEAFDKLWNVLFMATATQDTLLQLRIYRNLGITYELFNQDSLALYFQKKSLGIAKNFHQRKLINKSELTHCYFSLSTLYRRNNDYATAFAYLDSSEYYAGSRTKMPFSDADRGYMYLKQGKLDVAKENLYRAKKQLVKSDVRYAVVTLNFIGDLHVQESRNDSALWYYNESLKLMDKVHAHVEIRTDVLRKMATIYSQKGNYKKAFWFMEKSKEASDSLFNTTHKRNSKLFEIRNKYHEIIHKNTQQIKQQDAIIRENELLLSRLLFILISLVVIGISGIFVFRYRNRIIKLKAQQEMDRDKNDAVLEVKNKELTSYALKNVEKETAVEELLQVIKQKLPSDYATLQKKHVSGSSKMWDEFNLRFVELNRAFYKVLQERHPELSTTEQKHCALIKLNFDSRDMSQILNISLQSVHTSRYRIKKKLKLNPDASLEEYIRSL